MAILNQIKPLDPRKEQAVAIFDHFHGRRSHSDNRRIQSREHRGLPGDHGSHSGECRSASDARRSHSNGRRLESHARRSHPDERGNQSGDHGIKPLEPISDPKASETARRPGRARCPHRTAACHLVPAALTVRGGLRTARPTLPVRPFSGVWLSRNLFPVSSYNHRYAPAPCAAAHRAFELNG
jgi:hypothetical protein